MPSISRDHSLSADARRENHTGGGGEAHRGYKIEANWKVRKEDMSLAELEAAVLFALHRLASLHQRHLADPSPDNLALEARFLYRKSAAFQRLARSASQPAKARSIAAKSTLHCCLVFTGYRSKSAPMLRSANSPVGSS